MQKARPNNTGKNRQIKFQNWEEGKPDQTTQEVTEGKTKLAHAMQKARSGNAASHTTHKTRRGNAKRQTKQGTKSDQTTQEARPSNARN